MRKREENSGLPYKWNADCAYMIFMSPMEKKRKRWKMERNKHLQAGWASCFVWRTEAQHHYSPVIIQEFRVWEKKTRPFLPLFLPFFIYFTQILSLFMSYTALCLFSVSHRPFSLLLYLSLSGLFPPSSVSPRVFSSQFRFIYKPWMAPNTLQRLFQSVWGLE